MQKLALISILWGLMAASTAQARHYHINHGFYRGVPYAWGWYSPVRYVWAPAYTPWGYSYVGRYGYRPLNNLYAAISYDAESGRVGYSYDLNTRWQAVSAANRFCGTQECRSVVWVRGGCAAIAKGENSEHVGWGWDTVRHRARSRALMGCRQGGNEQCEVLAWVCTGR